MKVLLLCMALMLGLNISCATTSSGSGVSAIEKLPENTFQTILTYLRIGVNFGVTKIHQGGSISDVVLLTIATALEDAANKPASENVGNLISSILTQTLSSNIPNRALIVGILQIAEEEILLRGGFGVVKQADGTWKLSDRTKAILAAIAAGIHQALV